ncbi:sensor domain-containing phosphodiesterase [Kineococcus sp. SYSU DK005]|uniref:sensor domain-containing phosphodiesterase n=1 Tax=Kineococcus sp. SYSU DK005 TaxID=3383126 RepID=UPI003D7C79D3
MAAAAQHPRGAEPPASPVGEAERLAWLGSEAERLASLRSYQVLDSGADAALDALSAALAAALSAPAAAIALLDEDRLRFKSTHGLQALIGYEHQQIAWQDSFGAHLLHAYAQDQAQDRAQDPAQDPALGQGVERGAGNGAGGGVLVVPDASADARFASLPMVTGPEHLRAFAGAAVIGRDGLVLGVLCVLDNAVRPFTPQGVRLLSELAAVVAEVLELRRADAAAGLGGREVLAESHALRAGIEAGQMVVHYQPVVDLASQRWVGVEALVRWAHPQRGLLTPEAFLPLAEASGLIVPLGRQVLRTACAQVAAWRAQVPAAAELHLAVNVSARQLGQAQVHLDIAAALAESGLPARELIVELTETAQAGAGAEVDIAVQRIRELGVHLVLDDFGAGYASFAYLQRFQPYAVKIDRCFVAALGRSARDELLARSLVELARQLGCHIVAEGIEVHEQAQIVRGWGVQRGQGHLFSTARSAQEMFALLHHARA